MSLPPPNEEPKATAIGALPAHARDDVPTTRHLGGLLLILAAGTVWIAWAFFGTVLFASWFVIVFWSWRDKLVKKLKRTRLASLLLTILIVVALVGPVVVGGIFIVFMLLDFLRVGLAALHKGSLGDALTSMLGPSATSVTEGGGLRGTLETIFRSLPTVIGSIGTVFGVVADTIVRVFLFIVSLYFLFADGRFARAWVEQGSPLPLRQTQRLMKAYADIGRGMLVGVLLVVVIHGAIAMVGYLIVGVPRPIELGFLTALAGFVPGIGTGLVWVPLAIVLAVTGHLGKGIGVLITGIIMGTADNVARPYLAKLGQVPMPTLSLFWSIFAGIAVLGPVGLLIGPVIFGMAQAALELYIEDKEQRIRRVRGEDDEPS